MTGAATIEIRPATRRDGPAVVEFLTAAPPGPGGADASDSLFTADACRRVVAVRGDRVVGSCVFTPGAGRCAAAAPPRLLDWDGGLAARLVRAAAGMAVREGGVRLIQMLTAPDAGGPLARVLADAGFEPLATLAYLRRSTEAQDARRPDRPDLAWRTYSRLRHRKFARTISATYEDSLDCPRLAGLRPVGDTLETHKHTGTFSPRTWRLALAGGEPVGAVLVNNLQGRGELVYLGVVPGARRRGIGRALVDRAIRDTAELGLPAMGLAADAANGPAMRLYERAGFHEIRRRLVWFVPAERLAAL